jgi:shikimate dehydrogenase
MHGAGYGALGLPFVYVPFKVTDVAGALQGMRALGIRGLGVSYPYKQDVMKHLDRLDALAERIGAVNTIVNTEGTLSGHNTDGEGAVRALREVVALQGTRVLLLGAGGAARAIAHGLADAGARLTIANRSQARGAALAEATRASSVSLTNLEAARAFEVLVNATPLGMSDVDPRSPVPEEVLRPGLVVMDIVYKPLRTRLLAAAEARGATVVHGGRMLLHQAARQFELYTGRGAPLGAMDAALHESIGPAQP